MNVSDYLTTSEVAELLRIKERKVYDLASSGKIPCNKAIGKLLFPRDQINAWLTEHAEHALEPLAERPDVFLGSHDPLLEWALRESRCGIAMLFDGSTDGLNRFVTREGIATGLHIHHEKDAWNVPAVQRQCNQTPVVLIEWAMRQRGLIVSANHAKKIHTISDIEHLTMVPRQPEAGAQLLFEHLINQSTLTPGSINYSEAVRTEADVASAINSGVADAGFGLASIATNYNLHFIPLVHERFDLLIDRKHYFEKPMQTLLAFCRSERFATYVSTLAGYKVSGLGTVHFNGDTV